MLVYATHKGGRYLPIAESLREQPEGKRGLYINMTNQCNCDCVFCLRSKKEMAPTSSLWIPRDPTVEEIKAELAEVPWEYISEVVICGFGEPLIRLKEAIAVLKYIRDTVPDIPTRVNSNGLGELEHGREIAPELAGLVDTISISLNASNAERYLALTQSVFGIKSYEAMLTFAKHCKPYIKNVVLTIVDKVNSPEEIAKCQKICDDIGLKLRVRPYEDN